VLLTQCVGKQKDTIALGTEKPRGGWNDELQLRSAKTRTVSEMEEGKNTGELREI